MQNLKLTEDDPTMTITNVENPTSDAENGKVRLPYFLSFIEIFI